MEQGEKKERECSLAPKSSYPGRHAGHSYTLTGNEFLTVRQQVEILAGVLGRTIAYVEITPEEQAQAELARGLDSASVAANKDLNELARADRAAVITDAVHWLTGQQPASLESWYMDGKLHLRCASSVRSGYFWRRGD
jgi:uncharacterized protein YbjT (DUF2867 family)